MVDPRRGAVGVLRVLLGLRWQPVLAFGRPAGTVSVAAGALDPPTGLNTVHALFTAEASDYHRLDPDLPGHPHEGRRVDKS